MNKPLEQISPTCDSSRRQIGPTAFIAPDRGKVIQPTAAPWGRTIVIDLVPKGITINS